MEGGPESEIGHTSFQRRLVCFKTDMVIGDGHGGLEIMGYSIVSRSFYELNEFVVYRLEFESEHQDFLI